MSSSIEELTQLLSIKHRIEKADFINQSEAGWYAKLGILLCDSSCVDWLLSLSGVPDFFDRNKILSGYDLSHYQVPHCIRVFFYFVWFVFIHHNFQFYFKLCTYCNILDIYLS